MLRPVALRLSEIIQLATLRQALDLLTRTHNLPGLPARVTETLRIPAGAVRRAIQNLLSNQDHSRDRRCHPRPQDTIPDDRKNPREPMSGGGGGGGGSGHNPYHTNLDPKWVCFKCGGEQIYMSEAQMPRICTFDYPRLTKNTTGSVESSWVRSFQVDESWLMKIRCSKRALPPQIRSTLNNTAAPPQFYAGVSNSRDHNWPSLLNKVEQTNKSFRMTRSVESQKVRAADAHYLTTTGSAMHEGSVPALLRSKILVHLVFHANEQCAHRTWESQRSLYK